MLKGWLLYNKTDAKRNRQYINMYLSEAKKLNINLCLMYEDEISFDKFADFCIFRAINPILTKKIEDLGIKVYNNSEISEICNDKRKTYEYIKNAGIKIMDTVYEDSGVFFPCVVKSPGGRGGREVFLVESHDEFEKIKIKDKVIQKVCNNPGKDLRVYVIGREIIAAVLRTSDSDFRSNYSLGGKAALYNLSQEEIKTVNKIIALFEFGLVGIDFIFHDGKIVFNEIEDVVGSRMLYAVTDINIVEKYLSFILEDLK